MDRSEVRDLVPAWMDTRIASLIRGYETLRCLSGKTPKLSVNPCRKKYSTLPKFGIAYIPPHSGPRKRGVSRSSRHAGRAAVDAGHIGAKDFAGRATVSGDLARTTGVISVRPNRVVQAPGVCAPSLAVMCAARPGTHIAIRRATGAIVHRSPGRARHKLFQPLRREGRDVSGCPVFRCAL